ncbi:SOS response-associated peptidase family protein [Paenibacillus ginsengihumi]|uniref:SOS response-associated peptidase family protein n=1 Tax=Paenibacillus ginsengihumi TaxID=431596 RepID=UPI00037CC7D5|nr:SOS response-associated peptidase family protein [Paenibacillus ginsengihumi]
MCDRLILTADASTLMEQFQVAGSAPAAHSLSPEWKPVGFVAAIVVREGERRLERFRWGMMPFWAKDSVCADGEQIMEKRVYDRIVRKQRCIIPCSAFERVVKLKGASSPVRCTVRDRRVVGIAALYDMWDSASGDRLHTCTLLTLPNRRGELGDRLPVLLEGSDLDAWLDPSLTDKDVLQSLLRPTDASRLVTVAAARPGKQAADELDPAPPRFA